MSTVVITGGSRGIGAAAVELFCARGDRVYFLYEKNHDAAAAVAAKTGATVILSGDYTGNLVIKQYAGLNYNIDGNGHTFKLTGEINDGQNYHALFRTENVATFNIENPEYTA